MSMTFVVNEMEAHEKAEWQVLPLVSNKPGPLDNLSDIMVKWNKQAIHRPSIIVQIGATIREIITHPLRFSKMLFWMISLLVRSPLEFMKALYELTVCCCFAGIPRILPCELV